MSLGPPPPDIPEPPEDPGPDLAGRRAVDHPRSVAASRAWWDAEATAYLQEHGSALGEARLSWGPEGVDEEELHLLGGLDGATVLEFGAGAAQGARWCAAQGARVLATDLSLGMLRLGPALDARHPPGPDGYLTCDAARLPLAPGAFDVAFSSYGALPFVADSAGVLREVARVLRPGGRAVFSLTHPFRWAFPDVPGPEGLRVTQSYFDRTPYAEARTDGTLTYVEHHRTLGDRVREIRAAGLVLDDVVEPEWPDDQPRIWGGWSPLRGALLPGTAIFCTHRPL